MIEAPKCRQCKEAEARELVAKHGGDYPGAAVRAIVELLELVEELKTGALGNAFKRLARDRNETMEKLWVTVADNERLVALLRTATLERDAFLGKSYALRHLTHCQECGSYYDPRSMPPQPGS